MAAPKLCRIIDLPGKEKQNVKSFKFSVESLRDQFFKNFFLGYIPYAVLSIAVTFLFYNWKFYLLTNVFILTFQ